MSGPWLSVIETPPYLARAERVLSESERFDVVELIARDPECGVVIPGTGGVRKVRFGVADRGKSGGVRVVYYFYNSSIPVFMITVFAKNQRPDLSQSERNQLSQLVRTLVNSYGG